MKAKYMLTFFLLLLFANAFAQQIKKVKIEEVADYIKQADHPLIVNFWATWCGPCIEEIPWFQKVLNANAGKGLELLLVSLDFPQNYEKQITNFAQKKKLTATLYWLDETNADHFCPVIDSSWFGTIPVTVFINNKSGYRKFFDDQVPEKELEKIVSEMLK